MKRAVADEKKECADDNAGANLRPGRPKTFCQAPREENRSRCQVAQPRGVEWRNRFHGIANREVRGAPDEVNGKKGENNRDAMSTGHGPRGNRRRCCFDDDGSLVCRHAALIQKGNLREQYDLEPKWILYAENLGKSRRREGARCR